MALPVPPLSFWGTQPSYHIFPSSLSMHSLALFLSPMPQSLTQSNASTSDPLWRYPTHIQDMTCTHRIWFSSYFWMSESTSWDDSLKIDNRFSSRKLQGKLSSIYFKKNLKFQFSESWKATFLALQAIHILKLCPWEHNMGYFILLMLGNIHQKYEWDQVQLCSQFRAVRNIIPKKTSVLY